MMELPDRTNRWERFLVVLTLLCILAYVALFAIINFYGFSQFCDSDMYCDTIASKMIWDQKTLFPDGWAFSNQYYVVATPILAAFFYGITGNVNLGMVLATSLMTIFILASLYWVVRAFSKDTLVYLVGCLLLIASTIAPGIPGSHISELLFLQASYYSCYLITLFVVLGDYIRAFQSNNRRPAPWILSLLLCFATGMQSLRQTVIMVLPILCCELLFAFRRILHRQKPWNQENRGSLIRALSYGLANLAGVLTIQCFDIPHTLLYGDSGLASVSELPQRLSRVFESLAEITGLSQAFGDHGSLFIALISLFMVGLFVAAAVMWLLRICKQETPLEICWLVCLVGVFGICLSTIVTSTLIRTIYLFTWLPLVAFSGLVLLQKLSDWPKRIFVLIICVLSVGNMFHGYTTGAETALLNSSSYAGKAFRRVRNAGYKSYAYVDEEYKNAQELCQWMFDEGYEYLYGDWSVIPRIAAQSNGQLKAGCWFGTENTFEILEYLNLQDIYGEEENKKAVYVLIPEKEEIALQFALEQGVTMEKAAEFGDYLVYTSPVQLMHRSEK